MKLSIGQSIWHEDHKKTIRRLLKNLKGAIIIEWESQRNIGAVIPSVWQEWKDNLDPDVRRANELCACEPKPRNRQGRRRIAFGTKRRGW